MALDKIRPLKIESPSEGGTETDYGPTEVDPTEDYVSAKGIALEENDSYIMDLDASKNIQFKDVFHTAYITLKQLRTALYNIFDNSTNGFVSTDVQHAIEEAKQNAEGFPRAGLPLIMNGTVRNGEWIRYSELLSNPRILFPVKVRIKEITWVNNNTGLGAFDFEFYQNGQLAGNKVFTYTVPAAGLTAGYGYYSWTTNLDYNAGDSMYIKYVKPSGISLSDLALIIWIARIP